MARNRVIYQTEAVYVGPSPATGYHYSSGGGKVNYKTDLTTGLVKELFRVQSANYSFNIPRTDINQFGELAAIDRIILEQPTVSLNFDYILANVNNEKAIGFTISSGTVKSAISGILTKVEDEKNYFIKTMQEGYDVVSGADSNLSAIIGIGNGFIASYSTEGSVGNFPTASLTVEALNMDVTAPQVVATGWVPSVNPVNGTKLTGILFDLPTGFQSPGNVGINSTNYSISALRPGDITFTLGSSEIGPDFDDMKIQSYSVSFDLTREPLQKLGSKYAFSREISFPVTVSLNIVADVGDPKVGNMVDVINSNTTYNPIVKLGKPGEGGTGYAAAWYQLRGAKLDTTEYTSSIGPNKSVSLTWSAQVGGPNQTDVGLFISGFAL